MCTFLITVIYQRRVDDNEQLFDRNDLEGAMSAFEKACITYQCTPLKNELSKRLIDAEDANSLQRLTDLSTHIHGESNSLVDLVLSFLECGRVHQAKKILEVRQISSASLTLMRAKKIDINFWFFADPRIENENE